MKRAAAILALPLLLNPAAAQNTVPADVSSANIRAHMAFLASDRLRGREAGTPEYDLAANYVAAQMKGLGLSPMGGKNNGERAFFQHVPLVAYRTTDQGKLTLHGNDGRPTPLVFGKDYLVGASPLLPTQDIDAPLVFVGFGLVFAGVLDPVSLIFQGVGAVFQGLVPGFFFFGFAGDQRHGGCEEEGGSFHDPLIAPRDAGGWRKS